MNPKKVLLTNTSYTIGLKSPTVPRMTTAMLLSTRPVKGVEILSGTYEC